MTLFRAQINLCHLFTSQYVISELEMRCILVGLSVCYRVTTLHRWGKLCTRLISQTNRNGVCFPEISSSFIINIQEFCSHFSSAENSGNENFHLTFIMPFYAMEPLTNGGWNKKRKSTEKCIWNINIYIFHLIFCFAYLMQLHCIYYLRNSGLKFVQFL